MAGAVEDNGPSASQIPCAMRPDRLAYLMLLMLGATWGASFLLIKIAVATIPPLTLAAGRIVIGAAALVAIVAWRGDRVPREGGAWAKLLAMAILGTLLPFFLINWGEVRIASGLTAILMSAVPLSTVVLAHFVQHDERLSAGKVAGVALGGTGIVILVGPSVLGGLGDQLLGEMAVLGATLCYAANGIVARRMSGVSTEMMAAAMLATAALVAVPAALAVDRPWEIGASDGGLLALVGLGLVSTAGGYLLLFRIIGRAGAGFSSFVNFLVPPFGIHWGATLLGEALHPQALVGLAVILAGLAAPRLWPGRTAPAAR
jgi:drug/metabolite transporter (DMT)-like permease